MITFRDVEGDLIAYLSARLGVPVVDRVPSPRPARFVTVRRTGGPKRSPTVDAPLIDLEAWGARPADAQRLGGQMRDAVLELPAAEDFPSHVYRAREVGGLAYLPDPVTDQHRYVTKTEIHVRGVITKE
ncbi:hypothetical protein ACFYE2_00480 [Kocuria sp. CPCC 205300]|uniref:hypothetical protein n=1 Tax=Kocuria sabuli TaxID=3071448 RepID=UPI0036DCC3DD